MMAYPIKMEIHSDIHIFYCPASEQVPARFVTNSFFTEKIFRLSKNHISWLSLWESCHANSMAERAFRIFAEQIFDYSGFSSKIQDPLRPRLRSGTSPQRGRQGAFLTRWDKQPALHSDFMNHNAAGFPDAVFRHHTPDAGSGVDVGMAADDGAGI